ncbi:non-ribosomal peptide synthetase [Crocosphaera sp. XPORK-15E]|uniref:non-ribosomal peptide synthetase n=1 Tax=Crocosphaera sp. XPORK-15E TaxID=3110247 RepID=UPI002B21BA8A|nr:non-ribosomal peptide synthetase [Crocosphaera sp. XPORK-15E]MEA5536966.1 amino acid adenylation domain-containing protein [Crocosphaera sp. XPORK-15E]
MNINQLLTELADLGVKLWIEGEKLQVRAPQGVLTSKLRDLLKLHKPELISLLNRNQSNTINTDVPLVKVSREQNLPVSFAQERLWFLSQLEPENPAYNELLVLRLDGFLNVKALNSSLNQIIQRHEILRTNFTSINGQPIQVIAPSFTLNLSVVNLSDLPKNDRETAYQEFITKQIQNPFDLANEPLIQGTLLKVTETEQILLIKIHHIIWDAKSADYVFMKELAHFYTSFCKNLPVELPALPIQYVDFAIWQRKCCSSKSLAPHLDYWKKQLQNAPALLDLPTDRVRGITQSFEGKVLPFSLSPTMTEALVTFSQQREVTLFMTLLATFQVLLYRYTGQTDICVGTPITNRNRSELESLIGFFINMLVLRTDLSGNPRFEDLLEKIKTVALGAYEHQDLPFEKLVEELHPERNLSYTPLFQVGFALYAPMSEISMENLTVKPLVVETGTAKFDLSLALQYTETGLIGQWQYKTALFDEITIAKMAEHFQALLEGIIQTPEERISFLPILSTTEKQKLLFDWNCTQTPYPQNKCIHQLFEEQVEKTPDNIAVRFKNQQWTYQKLNTKANQLASYIQQLGVTSDVLVGICIERSPLMIMALLAILKAGGAYVPLDPHYPAERLAYILKDAQISVLITKQTLISLFPKYESQLICLDRDDFIFKEQSQENITNQVTPKDLAYIIYTSGSTGKPKGVMIEHHSVVNFVQVAIFEHQISALDHVLQCASINFDAAVEEIFPCLTTGGTLVLRSDEMLNSVAEFRQKCQDWQLTVLFLPTAYWQQLISELVRTNQSLPKTVRIINIGGERLVPEKFRLWQKYIQDHGDPINQTPVLIHGYGPTEATVVTTFCNLTQLNSQSWYREVPIGKPINNAEVYILDQYLQPLPVGVSGELYIGGEGLARGYFNQPELTKQKFIDNPFTNQKYNIGDKGILLTVQDREKGKGDRERETRNGEQGTGNKEQNDPKNSIYDLGKYSSKRLYKTGDLVRYLPSGNIEFLGRIDHQVKIRGFRIELGEIESVLTQHPGITEAVVVTQKDQLGNQSLVAYVICENQSNNQNQLQTFLKEKLPDYMIPRVFLFLEQLPLTPNGKVNRQDLPLPNWQNLESTDNFIAPETATQKILAQIWGDVLRQKQVGINDNFFELGGDSILSIAIIARANQAGLQLTPKQLFQHQTIAELAMVANTTTPICAKQELITGEIPLTPIQHWFFEQKMLEPQHFNQSMMFLVPANLKPDILTQAVKQLLWHHDALRICFRENEQGWQQINQDFCQDDIIEVVNLSEIPHNQQSETIEKIASQRQTNLNLSTGKLIKVVLFKLGNNVQNRLLIVIHHLVVDGVSWRILLEDISTVYQQLLQKETVKLPPKTTSFQDWAIRLQNHGTSEVITTELCYWLNQQCVNSLPLDKLGINTNTEASVKTITTALSKEETQILLEIVPKVYNTMINDVLLTALVESITQWTGFSSLLINLEGHGREDLFEDIDLSRTVGWFTTIFPILLNLKDAKNPQTKLKLIKEQLRTLPHRGIGYGILRYLSQNREISQQLQKLPVPEISFNYLGQFEQLFSNSIVTGFAPEGIGANFSSLTKRTHLLDVVGLISEGQLQITWYYSQNYHREETISHLSDEYINALSVLIKDCQLQVEKSYILSDFNESKLSNKKQIPFHLLQIPEEIGALVSKDIEDVYPLAKMQELMLHHYQKNQGKGVYHCQHSFNIYDDDFSLENFKESLKMIVQKHPILRTVFICQDKLPVFQAVRKNPKFVIKEQDISHLTSAEQENYLDEILKEDRQNPFITEDQEQLLLRFFIFKKDNQNIEFLMCFHHAIIDGWSSIELINELSELYSSLKQGENIIASNLSNTYKEFVALEKEILISKQTSNFWKDYLSKCNYKPLELEQEYVCKLDSAYEETGLSSETILELKNVSRRLKVSLKAIFLSAYLELFAQKQEDKIISLVGVISNGRTEKLSNPFKSLGLFWNIIPFYQSLINNKDLQVQNVQRSLIEIGYYSRYPFCQILSDQKQNNLFFATFNFLNFHNSTSSPEKTDLHIQESKCHDRFHFPLNCTISINSFDQSGTIRIEYDPNYFSGETIVERIKNYLRYLQ